MTKHEIKERFEEYKEMLAHTIGINQFNTVFPQLHANITFLYNQEILKIYNEINELIVNNDVFEDLKLFVEHLNNERVKNYNSPEAYGKKSAKLYSDSYKRLHAVLVNEEEKKNVLPINEKKIKTVRLPSVTDYNRPILKQKQVLLLMKLIKDEKLIINDIEDTALAECFGKLTGFSPDKLRQDFGELKKNEIEYSNEEINQLKTSLINMSKELDKIKIK